MAANVDANVHVPTEPAPPITWQEFAEYYYHWNLIWGILSAIAGTSAIMFVTAGFSVNLVKASSSNLLGANIFTVRSILMGLGTVAQYVTQLLTANFIETSERKKPIFNVLAIVGCSCLALCSFISYFLADSSPMLSFVLFSILYLTLCSTVGAVVLIMTDTFGKAFPVGKRSSFFGVRMIMNIIPVPMMGFLIEGIRGFGRSTSMFGQDAVSFLAALGVVGFGYFSFYLVKEPVHEARQEKKAIGRYLADAVRTAIVHDKNYRAFLVLCALQTIGGIGLTVGWPHLMRDLAQSYPAIRDHMLWVSLISVVAFPISGWLGNIAGSKWLLRVSAVLGGLGYIGLACVPLVASEHHILFAGAGWVLPTKVSLFIIMAALTYLGGAGHTLGQTVYPLDIAPAALRPTYIALAAVVLVLVTPVPWLPGLFAKECPYQVVFVICGVFFLLSLIPSFWMRNVTARKGQQA